MPKDIFVRERGGIRVVEKWAVARSDYLGNGFHFMREGKPLLCLQGRVYLAPACDPNNFPGNLPVGA